MAKKKIKKTAKKVVKKVLDSTTIDEKLVAEYKENKSLYDNNWVAVGLLCITSGWAYWNRKCKSNQTCCN